MRVLMCHTFHHLRGGDCTYTFTLSELLERDGHEVIPLAMRHPLNKRSTWERHFIPRLEFDAQAPKSTQARSLRRHIWNREAERAAAELIARYRPDVMHLQHVHHHLTPSVVRAAHKAGIPVVWTVHDYELICPEGHLFDGTSPCTACRGHQYFQAVRKRCKRGARGPSMLAALENSAHAAWGLSVRRCPVPRELKHESAASGFRDLVV